MGIIMGPNVVFKATDGTIANNYTFQQMLQKISMEVKISPQLISKYSLLAFQNWETHTGKSLAWLSNLHSEDRSAHIYMILDLFRQSLDSLYLDKKALDRTLHLASVSMELLFDR
jgi:hypothetical protein